MLAQPRREALRGSVAHLSCNDLHTLQEQEHSLFRPPCTACRVWNPLFLEKLSCLSWSMMAGPGSPGTHRDARRDEWW